MALRFYNTLTRKLERFEPLEPGTVRMYACGPTVYQPPHIGNYRTFLFNDLLHRYLEWKGYDVTYITNLTDVDDKTIHGALEEGVSLDEFTEPVIRGFFDDFNALGVRQADAYPRATRHIDEMIALIERLIEREHAYVVDGSVYFDISSFPDYGKLSRIDPAEMRQGERVAADEYGKDDIRDFALWKKAKAEDHTVGAVWKAPWGEGRPGWHIECSAMSMAELGESFDIHTGGEDLIFPHHEDEIAQAEGATDKPFARFWLHAKHLLVEGEKMSKSKGNDFTLHDLRTKGYSIAAVRYLLLSAHYRHELNFTFDGLEDAQAALQRLSDFRHRLETVSTAEDAERSPIHDIAAKALQAFEEALDDDLNTPAALAAIFNFVRETNAALDAHTAHEPTAIQAARDTLSQMDDVFGVADLAEKDQSQTDPELVEWVQQRLQDRQDARARRDFDTADAIRAELTAAGILIEDTPQGPRWRSTG